MRFPVTPGLEPLLVIQRVHDGAMIPADPNNVDYVAYLEWAQVDGNEAEVVDFAPTGE
jgi:hypothetical protein